MVVHFLVSPSSHNRPDCDLLLNGDCYSRAVMSKQPDFKDNVVNYEKILRQPEIW